MLRTIGLRRVLPGVLGFVCALVILPAYGVRTAHACPAPPRLSEYISDANAIVVATARDLTVENRKVDENEFTVQLATLDIVQSLKGPFDGSQPLTVAGMSGFGDGSDGLYLVFIGTPEGDSDLLAYESIDVTDRWRRDVFAARVAEYLATLDIEDSVERARHQGEWSIRCIEEEPTREWGMGELGRTGVVYDLKDDGEVSMEDTIDTMQVERLITVLQSIDRPDAAYPLLSYLARFKDMRVVDQLRVWIANPGAGERDDTGWLMQLAAAQLDWTTGQWLAAKYYDAETPRAKADVKAQFESMITALDELPEALAADAEARANAEAEAARAAVEQLDGIDNNDTEDQQVVYPDVIENAPDDVVVSVEELQAEPALDVESPQR